MAFFAFRGRAARGRPGMPGRIIPGRFPYLQMEMFQIRTCVMKKYYL